MDEFTLNGTFDILGAWFLPEEPDREVSGNIYSQPDKTELRLMSPLRLSPSLTAADNLGSDYPVIHGYMKDGQPVTLLGGVTTQLTVKHGGGTTTAYETVTCLRLLVGALVDGSSQFSEARFRISFLNAWFARPISSCTTDQQGNVHASFPSIPESSLRIDQVGYTLSFSSTLSMNALPCYSDFTAKASSWVVFRADKPATIEWFLEQFQRLINFLVISCGNDVSADLIELSLPGDGQPTTIIAKIAMRPVKEPFPTNPHELLFDVNTYGLDIDAILAHWLGSSMALRPLDTLAADLLAVRQPWSNAEFLSLMQLLEAIHRKLFPGVYMAEPQYAQVADGIVGLIPKTLSTDHRQALQSRIKYGNQYSLRKRLKELASMFEGELKERLFGDSAFIDRLVGTRNFHTHLEPELQHSAIEENLLYLTNIRLGMAVRALFLKTAGVPAEAILRAALGTSDAAQSFIYATRQLNSRPV